MEIYQTAVDGNAFLGAVAGGAGALQPLWSGQVDEVEFRRQSFQFWSAITPSSSATTSSAATTDSSASAVSVLLRPRMKEWRGNKKMKKQFIGLLLSFTAKYQTQSREWIWLHWNRLNLSFIHLLKWRQFNFLIFFYHWLSESNLIWFNSFSILFSWYIQLLGLL